MHSKHKNTENDLIDVQKQNEPGKMEKSDLETEPAANTDYDELRAEVPVLPHDTESKSAIDNHSVPENSNTGVAGTLLLICFIYFLFLTILHFRKIFDSISAALDQNIRFFIQNLINDPCPLYKYCVVPSNMTQVCVVFLINSLATVNIRVKISEEEAASETLSEKVGEISGHAE